MKYSQLFGCIAVFLLAAICYLPWSYIPDRNIIITGMSAPDTIYGKPGLMHFVLGVILIIFFITPKVWAKRINVFIAALNVAWTVRNYILLSTCYMGECPERKAGIFLAILLSLFILIMSFLPDLNTLERKK